MLLQSNTEVIRIKMSKSKLHKNLFHRKGNLVINGKIQFSVT